MDHRDYPEDQHQVRLMAGDPMAQAYEWIKAYAENLTDRAEDEVVTMDELIETAMTHVDTSSRWGGDYISRGGAFEGFSTDPTFWDKLAILKNIEIPTEKRNNFFSC